jgi:hypothetical protein
MVRLEKTAAALYDLLGGPEVRFGQHITNTVVAGQYGLAVGETMLDPTVHDMGDMNPFALTPMMLEDDIPYVDLNMPYRSVELNVIVDDDSAKPLRHEWLRPMKEYRQTLAKTLVSEIEDSKQPEDVVNLHVIGSPSDPESYGRGVNIQETKSPEESAKVAAEICRNGIAIIISNFMELPIGQSETDRFSQLIAVKANYPIELSYPANSGVWSLGGTASIDTNNSKELRAKNVKLAEFHQSIVRRLVAKGAHIAHVVYDPNFSDGFNKQDVDFKLAQSVRELL